MPRFRTLTTLVLMLALLGAVDSLAQDKEERKPVDLQALVIRATTKNKDISPELRALADKLKEKFKFTGFKLEKRATGKAKTGEGFKTSLVGGYEASITPQKREGKSLTLEVEVVKGRAPVLKTTFTIEAERYQLLGGWELDGGDALIVAVSAR